MSRVYLLGIWLLCTLTAAVSLVWSLLAIVVASGRAWSIIQAFDRLGNAATGGDPREYISDRAWRWRGERAWAWWLVRTIERIDPDHFEGYPN